MRAAHFATWLLIGLAAAAAARAAPLPRQAVRAIDAAMTKAMKVGAIPGGAVEVTQGGQVVFAKAYGAANLELSAPSRLDTVFRIGSLSKQFTAVAVLLLAEDGKLSLDDPVSKYVPEFPAAGTVPIRRLLNHTSGIADYVGSEGFETKTRLAHSPVELVRWIASLEHPITAPPGQRWEYSSSNYAIAGLIVERVSGQPLGQFLQTRMFNPLGMNRTRMDDALEVAPGRASGYDPVEGHPGRFRNAHFVDMTVPYAAGGLRSTVGDLATWEGALVHGRVLRPDSYRQLVTPARLSDGSLPTTEGAPTRYGLGVSVPEPPPRPTLSHTGAIDGFTSSLDYYAGPDATVVVLVNGSPSPSLPFKAIDHALQSLWFAKEISTESSHKQAQRHLSSPAAPKRTQADRGT